MVARSDLSHRCNANGLQVWPRSTPELLPKTFPSDAQKWCITKVQNQNVETLWISNHAKQSARERHRMFGSASFTGKTISSKNINNMINLRCNATDVHAYVQSLPSDPTTTSGLQTKCKELVDKFDEPQMFHWLQVYSSYWIILRG